MDNYTHIDNSIFYITESIPGPTEASLEYETIVESFNSQIIHPCECVKCLLDCPCINTNSIASNAAKCYTDFLNISLTECNDCCSCSHECRNRVVQRGPIPNLYIKKCEFKGYGLFTSVSIPSGTFICEYAGEILTKAEAAKRHNFNTSKNKSNYIFRLNEIVNDKIIETYIDPSLFGNIGRYINHSCEPNAFILPVRVNNCIPKLAIFSSCDIPSDSEITFNYGSENNLTSTLQSSRMLCYCCSSKCLGYLPFEP